MKTNGSAYVAVVFAALIGYFSYQWWFNPSRMVEARLGEVAAALSVPASEARPRACCVSRGCAATSPTTCDSASGADEIMSRDAAVGRGGGVETAAGSGDVQFVDVQVLHRVRARGARVSGGRS